MIGTEQARHLSARYQIVFGRQQCYPYDPAVIGQPIVRGLAQAAFGESASPELAALTARQLALQADAPVRALVLRARARGEWRGDAPPEVVLWLLVGAILHRTMLEHHQASAHWLSALLAASLTLDANSKNMLPAAMGGDGAAAWE